MSEALDRARYEADIISLRAWGLQRRDRPGMSDEDRGKEYEAARIFYQELAAFRSALTFRVLPLTELRKSQIQELLDAMEDYTPDPVKWENAVTEARND